MWKRRASCLVALLTFAACLATASSSVQADGLRLVVERGERVLHVHRGEELMRTYQVATGKPDHETPLGSWKISQVDINPDWDPPNAEWTADETAKEPGEEGNPMGRVRLNFDPPYSIHGTDVLESLGEAASHGSIRMANEEVIELARLVLEAGGSWEGEEWYEGLLAEPTVMHEIVLADPVPIDIDD